MAHSCSMASDGLDLNSGTVVGGKCPESPFPIPNLDFTSRS
jgi:hypothetical protein